MAAIPLQVYITSFSDGGAVEPAQWDQDKAAKALDVVNVIWSKARISFSVDNFVTDQPVPMASDIRSSDVEVLGTLAAQNPRDGKVRIYLLNRIRRLIAGGGSYLNSDPQPSAFVQLYDTADSSGRAWAHEMGHLLSLDHVEIDFQNAKQAAQLVSNLMRKGLTVGRDLTSGQISQAKRSKLAVRYGG